MGGTKAVPPDDFDFGHLGLDVLGQMLVGDTQNAVHPQGAHHIHRVGAGAAHIAFGLHFRRGVNIRHHRHAVVLRLELNQILAGDHIRHGASGIGVAQKNLLLRGKKLCGFRHKVHAAKHNDIGIGFCRLLA